MLSKILPFNQTLLEKDWKINKWSVVGIFLILFLAGPYTSWSIIQDFYQQLNGPMQIREINFYNLRDNTLMNQGVIYMVMFVAPVILSTLMMGEEKKRRTMEICLGGPYSRYTVFFNKMVFGLGFLMIPLGLTGLIYLVMIGLSKEMASMIAMGEVWLLMFKALMIGLSMFSFATLIGMLCSSFFLQGLLTLIFVFFPVGFMGILIENINRWGGYGNDLYHLSKVAESITPGIYFGKLMFLDGVGAIVYGLTMLAISLLSVVVSGVLFDVYKVERGPEALTFEKTEGFFRVGVIICSVLLGGILISSFARDYSLPGLIAGYLLGGALGYFVPKILIIKNRVA